MINIAIVEDNEKEMELLNSYLIKNCQEKKFEYSIVRFNNAFSFLKDIDVAYDMIFLDIELPDGNGMELAKKIRQINSQVIIIFVTNMAQYALKGYEVRAFDFIVKPVNEYNFAVKFSSAINCLNQKKDKGIWISNKDGRKYLLVSNIIYVEVVNHMIDYHTIEGVFSASGSLNSIQQTLGPTFSLCNRCYLVNLRYVTAIDQYDVTVGKEKLQISRAKRKNFIRTLNNYYASGD